MANIEFKSDSESSYDYSTRVVKEGMVTRIIKKLSFGMLKTKKQVDIAMILIAIIFFGLTFLNLLS